MSSLTITYLKHEAAESIRGSSGKPADRLEFSCFPKENNRYWFRCEIPKDQSELQPLLMENPPPVKTGCCGSPPRFVEVTLSVNNQAQRILLNLNSMTKRIGKPRAEVYHACVEGRIVDFLTDVGLPLKWKSILSATLLPKETRESIIPFLSANWREWKARCDSEKIPSLFFPAKDGRKFDVEYLADGSILIHYNDKGKQYAVDLSGQILNPEVKELTPDQIDIYRSFEGKFTNGILQVYRISEYPAQNRYHALIGSYKNTMDEFFLGQRGSVSGSLGKRGASTRMTAQLLLPWQRHKVTVDLLEGLAYLHENKIFHFSIQPKSLSIQPSWGKEAPKGAIGKLECARKFDKTMVGTRIQTDLKPPYLDPKLKTEKNQIVVPQDPFPSEVYALGKSLFNFHGIKDFTFHKKEKDSWSTYDQIEEAIYHMVRTEPEKRSTAEKALRMMKAIEVASDTDLDNKLNLYRPRSSTGLDSREDSLSDISQADTPPPILDSTKSNSPSILECKDDSDETDSKHG